MLTRRVKLYEWKTIMSLSMLNSTDSNHLQRDRFAFELRGLLNQ